MTKNYRLFRIRIAAAILFFSLVPIFFLGFFLYHHFYKSYSSRVFDSLRSSVQERKNIIDLFFAERVSQLITIVNSHSFESITRKGYLEELFSSIQSVSKYYVDIGIIDNKGNHVYYVGPYNLKGLNYQDTEWFHQVCLHGVYISDVFLGFRQIPHFIIAVMKREGEDFWILRVTINTDLFESLVLAAKRGKYGDAFLINAKGEYQTNPQQEGLLFGGMGPIDTSFFEGTQVYENAIGERKVIAARTWLERKKWMLVVIEDPKEELFPISEAKQLVLLLVFLGLVMVIIGALWSSTVTMRQIEEADREIAAINANLMHSSKMAALGRLAAGVAHEINNPLAIIREQAGWIKDLLEEEDISSSENFREFAKAVDKIEYHVERAREVTHRLLGFARRMEPKREKVQINKVIEETLGFLENEALHRNIVIHKDLVEDLEIVSDASQLQQIFLNILNNAIDAVEKDGNIWVETKASENGEWAVVEISDSGPGIPQEMIGKIFDPFVSTKPVGKGTGLGLSIVHNIVRNLGGNISATNGEHKGAVFTIKFPIHEQQGNDILGNYL